MLPGMRSHLRKSIDNGILDVEKALFGVAWLTQRMKKAAHKEYKPIFGSLTRTLESTAILIHKEEEMAKFELGITVGEITAMLPDVMAEAWAAYSDDKKISVDEGLGLVAVILGKMSEAADEDEVKALFSSIQETVLAVVPFVEEEEVPEEPAEPVE